MFNSSAFSKLFYNQKKKKKKIIKKQMDQLFEKFEEGLNKEEIQMVNKYIELNC